MERPSIPTLILIGMLDDWTPAAACSDKVASWGSDGPSIEPVIYPGAYHGFYYQHLQPGTRTFDHWLEYNGGRRTVRVAACSNFLIVTSSDVSRYSSRN